MTKKHTPTQERWTRSLPSPSPFSWPPQPRQWKSTMQLAPNNSQHSHRAWVFRKTMLELQQPTPVPVPMPVLMPIKRRRPLTPTRPVKRRQRLPKGKRTQTQRTRLPPTKAKRRPISLWEPSPCRLPWVPLPPCSSPQLSEQRSERHNHASMVAAFWAKAAR